MDMKMEGFREVVMANWYGVFDIIETLCLQIKLKKKKSRVLKSIYPNLAWGNKACDAWGHSRKIQKS